MQRLLSGFLMIGLLGQSAPWAAWANGPGPVVVTPALQRHLEAVERDMVMDRLLERLEHPERFPEPEPHRRRQTQAPQLAAINRALAPVKISGEYRTAFGADTEDLEFQEANGDLNERNFRILSGAHTVNTFDPRLYSRLRLNVDTERPEGWNLHSNITIDPWSVVGTTRRIDVTGTGGDRAEVELKWWSNTGKTINETFFTQANGDSFAAPEIKVVDGHTTPTTITSAFSNSFRIPELEIRETFQPIRELRFDYLGPEGEWRLFPWGLEDQAVTSDDPLGLSNHHIYWEPSPWLDAWVPGIDNVGTSPRDVTRGNWSDDLTFFTRDSDLTRLTALRGTSLHWQPSDQVTWQGAFASPKGLWQEFDSVPSFLGMARMKSAAAETVTLGGTYTTRFAYHEGEKDADNNVFGVDVKAEPSPGTFLRAEWATSRSVIDQTTSFKSDARGHAWTVDGQLSLPVGGSNTWKVWYAHLDAGFDPGLANYRETRDDQFWSRHLHFRPPLRLLTTGITLYQPALRWEDIEPFRLGDGIDIGRDTVGTRLSSELFDDRLVTVLDLRNVHAVDGKYLETVFRAEQTAQLTSRLTGKWLVLRHDVPKTIGGVDPFVIDADTDRAFRNAAIVDGQDPSLTTVSPGLQLALPAGWSVYGGWEHTNDTSLAYDNYPRGLFNSSSFTTFRDAQGGVVRIEEPFLYSQGFFPLPPYAYYDIFRAGISWQPSDQFEWHLEWTRNPFEQAGQIDDNMNRIATEIGWYPNKRWGLVGKYTLSRSINLARMNNGGGAVVEDHHNLFAQLRYRMSDANEFVIEFGESAVAPPVYLVTASPFGGYEPTLDTIHLVRVYLVGKF